MCIFCFVQEVDGFTMDQQRAVYATFSYPDQLAQNSKKKNITHRGIFFLIGSFKEQEQL